MKIWKLLVIVAAVVCAYVAAEENGVTSLQMRHAKNLGHGFLVSNGRYAITVAHGLKNEETGDYDLDAVLLNGKGTKVLVISSEFDLVLLDASGVDGTSYVPSEQPLVKGSSVQLIIGRRTYDGQVSSLDKGTGPNKKGKLFEVRGFYKLGFSGAPLINKETGLLVGMSSAGYIAKTNRAGEPIEAKDDKGLFVPASTIIRFLKAAEQRLSAKDYDGKAIRLSVKDMN